ncbi:MAG: flagellar hook-basal body complex protein FliE [Clostridium sp.]|uniref:flagellar hook-basal body complex protein FliE n=1 Tax=Clostridium sp. TaxID=1506 RepID=UPI002FCCA874
MRVDGIGTLFDSQINKLQNNKTENIENTKGFGDFVKDALNKVNDKMIKSDDLTQKAILGQVDNVHEVLVAAEEARLSLELTVQIRNKIVEAYQEINRMQF